MFTVLVAFALVIPTLNQPMFSEAGKKELTKLEGKWKLAKVVDTTKDMAIDPKEDGVVFSFAKNELTITYRDKNEILQIVALDPSTDPKCLDLGEKRLGKPDRTTECVYNIDGDTLQIAIHFPRDGKQRPVGFEKPSDPRTAVWTLKRVKE